jgi:hypothetical protein
MIGTMFALLLGGAQGVPVVEAWNAATVRLMPAKVLSPDQTEGLRLAGVPEVLPGEPARGGAAKADPDADLMPLRLERAVVTPSL